MKKLLKGVKRFMQEKYEAAKDAVMNPTIRFIAGSAILALGIGLGGSMVVSCFIERFN